MFLARDFVHVPISILEFMYIDRQLIIKSAENNL